VLDEFYSAKDRFFPLSNVFVWERGRIEMSWEELFNQDIIGLTDFNSKNCSA
jgi:hypothetical protein